MTIAYDARDGTERWRSGFGSPAFLDAAFGSALSPDGSVLYQLGIRLGGNPQDCDFDIGMAALDASTGQELWSVILAEGTAARYDAGYGIALSPDGERAIVSGTVNDTGSRTDFFTASVDVVDNPQNPTDQAGEVLWRATFDDSDEGIVADDIMSAMTFDPGKGHVYVTGKTFYVSPGSFVPGCSGCDGSRYSTVAYDASTGEELWRSTYETPIPGKDTPHAIAVSPDGARIFVTGESHGLPDADWDYATVAYDAVTGAQLWATRYGAPTGHIEWAYDVIPSPDGSRVYVTGESTHAIGAPQLAATIAYDAATGRQIWVGRYDGSNGPTESTHGNQMALAADGSRLFISGWSQQLGEGDRRGVLFAYELD
jgi:outer membrane protein assembly factor BamB